MSRVFVVEHAVAGLEPGTHVGEEQLAHLQLDALLTGGFLSETTEPAVNQGVTTMTETPAPEPTAPEPEPQPEPEPEPAAPEGA